MLISLTLLGERLICSPAFSVHVGLTHCTISYELDPGNEKFGEKIKRTTHRRSELISLYQLLLWF